MVKNKIKVNETLNDFLFNQIENNPDFIEFVENYEIPDYITSNISRTLRPYQELALKHFIYLFEKDPAQAKLLLFNMTTGTGKTLVMACCVLYLFEKGYRNFLFLVHQVQIETQAKENFTNYKFEKYYFNPKGIRINGKRVKVCVVDDPNDGQRGAINFMFYSTQLLYSRLLMGAHAGRKGRKVAAEGDNDTLRRGSYVARDVNADGSFNVSDLVLLQRWLLAAPDAELANWQAGDLCEDNRLNVFDLCLMRRMLVE